MNNKKAELKKLTNKELFKRLTEVDWCDRELLKEYDERSHDGRIKPGKPIPLNNLEDYIKNKYTKLRQRKAS